MNNISKGCENCGEIDHLEIHEQSSNIKLLFIPVGRSNFSYSILCKKCHSLIMTVELKHFHFMMKKDLIERSEGALSLE